MSLRLSTAVKNQTLNSLAGAVAKTYSLNDGRIAIYTGSQPASADAAATGTLLGTITKSAGSYSAGVYQSTDDDNVCASQSVTSGSNMSLNGAGAGTLGVGYFVTISSAGTEDLRTANFRITGTGNNDEAIVEYIDGGNNATVYTTNQFKTVTEIYPRKPAVFTSNVKVGYAITNGLAMGAAASGEIAKSTAQTWQMTAVATGTAGWFRWMGDDTDAGSISTTLPRVDGRISTSGAELNLSNTSIVSGSTITIDTFEIAWPSTI